MRWAGYLARIIEMHAGFWWGNLRERDLLEEPGLDGRVMNMNMDLKVTVGVDWIDLARDRAKWRAVMNTVMNLWFP